MPSSHPAPEPAGLPARPGPRAMTPRPPSDAERELELMVAATAAAHAAGVCGSLLRDRVDARYAVDPQADVVGQVRAGQFPKILSAAERFQAAVLGALDDLEPGARIGAAQIAQIAYDSARAGLVERIGPVAAARRRAALGGDES
jgi:hypothetical protein